MDICNIFKEYTGTNLINDINRNKVLYNVNNYLSYLQYISLYCLKHNVGNVELARKIVQTLQKSIAESFGGTVTLTFGDVAESHQGMQQIGNMAETGFSYDDLLKAQTYFRSQGCETFIIRLNDWLPKSVDTNERENNQLKVARDDETFQAYLLVARDGLKCLDTNADNLLSEVLMFDWDTKVWNVKQRKVQNKQARYNLNFSDEHQTANFEKGEGTTISWAEVPLLKKLKSRLVECFGEKAQVLKCEGNLYYSKKDTGIGYHGDAERKRVIGARLGGSMTINYNWYYNNRPRGKNISLTLNSGDIYCMSEKTVGTDWMLAPKHKYTLRHAAGASKYTTKTPTLKIVNQKVSEQNENVIVGDICFKPKKSQSNPNPVWNNCNDIQEF